MNNFSNYKESNISWIGKIPDSWDLLKIKDVFFEKKSLKNQSLNPGSISFGEVIYKDLERVSDEMKESYQEVLAGEFLVNPLNLNYDLKSLRIALSKINVVVSQGYIVLRIKEGFHPDYFQFLLRKFDVEYMKSLGQGVRQTISFSNLKNEKIVIPPFHEQKLISEFLKIKTQNIDNLIERIKTKKQLIKEGISNYYYEIILKRTKLNFYKSYWFQCAPNDWEITKFKNLFEPIKVINNSPAERLLSVTQGKGVVFRDEQQKDVVNPSGDISSYKLVEPGDFVISLRSADGGIETSDIRGLVSPAYTVLRPKLCIDRNFYRFLLTSKNFIAEINRYIKGIRDGKNIYFEDIKNVLIPYIPEYKRDEKYHNTIKLHMKLTNSFPFLDKKITLLEEYKHQLISSYVIGKYRVNK